VKRTGPFLHGSLDLITPESRAAPSHSFLVQRGGITRALTRHLLVLYPLYILRSFAGLLLTTRKSFGVKHE